MVAAGLLTFPILAVITAVPGVSPVTRPLSLTMATPAALLCQVNVAPLTGLPLGSLAPAVSCCVPPTAMLALIGDSEREDTGALTTVRVAGALVTPEAVAVICVVPALCAVAMPELSTVATLATLLAHVKAALTVFPPESVALAVKVCCPFTLTEGLEGETVIVVRVLEEELDEPPPQAASIPAIKMSHNPLGTRSRQYTSLLS